MKRKLFRKNLYSFSKQGLAENLLPVFKEFKKKLVKSSRFPYHGINQRTKSKLDRNFSADTFQSVRSKLPYYPLNPSRRVQKGKARLFSQFFNNQIQTQRVQAKGQKRIYDSFAIPNKFSIPRKINIGQSSKLLSFASSKNCSTSINSLNTPGNSAIDIIKTHLSKYQNKKEQKTNQDTRTNLHFHAQHDQSDASKSRWNARFQTQKQRQNISSISLLLSVQQVNTEIQGPSLTKTRQKKEYTPFLNQIRETKKLRYLYGNLSATQLKKTIFKAHQLPGTVADNLLILLESRLDVVCQRCQFFATIKAARQYIAHKGVWINSMLVTAPSYQLSPGDVIRIIEPNKLENSILSLPLKKWKKMCQSIDNLEVDIFDKKMLHNPNEKEIHKGLQKQSNFNSQNFKTIFQKAKENFLELAKNQYEYNLSSLDVSVLEILAFRFIYKNRLYWKAHTSDNFNFLFFHSSGKNKNVTKFANMYKKWFLLSFFTSAITNNPNLLLNKFTISSQKQIESIASLMENLKCTHFISTITTNLPNQLQKSFNKNTSFSVITNKLSITSERDNQSNDSKSVNNIKPSQAKKKDTVFDIGGNNLFVLNQKMLLKNNLTKKLFFDFLALTQLEIESLFFSNQVQQEKLGLVDKNFQHSIVEEKQKKAELYLNATAENWDFLQPFFITNRNLFKIDNFRAKKENFATNQKHSRAHKAITIPKSNTINSVSSGSIAKKKFLIPSQAGRGNYQELQKINLLTAKKVFALAQKLSSFFIKEVQKKATQSSQNLSNKIVYLTSSPKFSTYLFCIFLLHIQKHFLKRYWKKKEILKNNLTSSTSKLSTSTEKIQKNSTFYQKKSKALHVEVSYQSLAAIFLFPPQRVYLNAIVDLQTIVKSALK